MMKKFTLLLLSCLMSVVTMAQSRNINLTIGVTGPGSVPLPQAAVTLMQTDYSLSYGTLRLNDQGQLRIKVYPGNHRLSASLAGYNDGMMEFNVASDTTVTLQLQEENTLPFSLQTSVVHNAVTGLNDVTLTWNKEAPVFYDTFEDYEPFAIQFSPWTGIDADGLMTAPLVGDYVNRGVMQYAQIMNPLAVQPAWWYDYPILRPYNGQQYVGFVRTYSGAANDDWLISPVVTPGNKNVLAFMAKAADIYKEKFQVYITEKLDNPVQTDFKLLNAGNYEQADYTGWREYSYDLSEYAGRPVRFAIRYISEAQMGGAFMLMVDDVYVGQDQSIFRMRRHGQRAHRLPLRSPMNPNETFRIYLNGTQVGTTDGYEYVFNDLPAGTYTLGVQAVYASSQTEVVTTTLTLLDTNGRVTVNVTTNNGQSLDGQTVELTDRATTHTYSAVIADGQAVFASVPYGEYLVGVTAQHYQTYDGELTVAGDCTLDIVVKETVVNPYNITADADSLGNVTVRWNQNLSFTDSFEDYPDFAQYAWGEWRSYDLDQHPVYPIALGSMTNIISFPGSGTANAPTAIAPMVFNPWQTVPAMLPTDPAVQAPTGDKTIIFFSAQQNGSNKWLVSPVMKIREGYVCRFTAKAYDQYPETMEVCVFTEGGDPSTDAYDQVSSISQVTTGQWTIYETDLSQYAGQEVRIGVHYMSFDAFFTQIDDFYVGNGQDEGSTIDVGYIQHYEVVLDGTLKGTTTVPQFTFSHLSEGLHKVGVKAIYASGASQLVEYEFTVPHVTLKGDVDGNGSVGIEDVNAVINVMLGKAENAKADVSGNGSVGIEDVNAVINMMLGK
ncbi:MAG: choice-of-anchor J domain-containing protein [Muribaculaceae bacterium]|nr:choice-of-anchor J domain-containing protein [Muribaculaceae bacterium]